MPYLVSDNMTGNPWQGRQKAAVRYGLDLPDLLIMSFDKPSMGQQGSEIIPPRE